MNKDKLFLLIKQLTKSEKRYFKIQTQSLSGSSEHRYLVLFDIFEQQKDYNEKEIAASLKKNNITDNLSANKHYLYGLLLDNLRSYQAKSKIKSGRYELNEIWMNIHILIDKGLIGQVKQQIAKAKKIATQFHLLSEKQNLLLFERKLIIEFERKQTLKKLVPLRMEFTELENKLEIEHSFLELWEEVFHAERKNDIQDWQLAIDKWESFYKKFTTDDLNEFSFWTKVTIKNILFLIHKFKNNYQEVSNNLDDLFQIYENEKGFTVEYEDKYQNLLNNYFNNCVQGQKIDLIPIVIEKFKVLKPRSQRSQVKKEQHTLYFQMLYFLIKKEYKNATKLASPIKICLSKHKNQLTISRRLTFLYNTAIAFFMAAILENKPIDSSNTYLNQCIEWINEIENEPKFETKTDIKKLSKLLFVLCHFELGHETFLEYRISTILYYLRKAKSLNSVEGIVLTGLKKVILAPDKQSRESEFRKIHKKINHKSGIDEILIWLNLKLT